jgi:ADP-heptose:LPS heptosyltransferase
MTKIKRFLKQLRLLIRIYDVIISLKYSFFEYLIFLFKYWKSIFEPQPKNILLIMAFGIGDIIRTTPVIEKLRKKYSMAKIDYMTQSRYTSIIKYNPFINKILLNQNYDLVVNFQLFDNSVLIKRIMRQIKFKKVLGSHYDKKGQYRHIQDLYARNWVEEFSHVANVSYQHRDIENIRIYLPREWPEKLNQLYNKFSMKKDKMYIGIHLGADDTNEAKLWYRNYSLEFLRRMVEYLIKDYSVILTGRSTERKPDEKEALKKIITDFPSIINLIDRLNLEELILIIKNCRCYISSDTGPLHIAIALGTPLVALFGQSSSFKEVGPNRFTKRCSLLQSDFKCSPCGWRINEECLEKRRAACMEKISLDKILSEVKRLTRINSEA